MMRATVSSLVVVTCLAAVGAAPGAPAKAQAGVHFYARSDGYPFSSAVQVDDVLYLSGQIGVAEDQKSVVPGGMAAEARRMMELIGQTLNGHGLTYADLFKCTVLLADMRDWPAFNAIYADYFEPGHYPTRSAMGVNGLALDARVEMECWAYAPREDLP